MSALPDAGFGIATLAAAPGNAEVLRHRAELLARRQVEPETTHKDESCIHFRLGKTEEYGIPYHFVEEVMTVPSITRVPSAPPIITGVINRRGDMLAVLSLRQFFRIEAPPSNGVPAANDVVVVRAAGLLIGIGVDELIGNTEYDPARLDEPLPGEDADSRAHVLGLLRGRITILNLDALLADPAFHPQTDTS